jgi:MFS family permease
MTMTATYGTLSASEHSTQLRKAVIASIIGTAIEWYDFFLYGTVAGLIFGKLFFPNSDPLTATLAAFGTYFIDFAGRPIGAAIFGHYGDRIGRKATLIATLSCMGIATFLIAFVPTYETIGIWGAVILRCCVCFRASVSAANGVGPFCSRWNEVRTSGLFWSDAVAGESKPNRTTPAAATTANRVERFGVEIENMATIPFGARDEQLRWVSRY